MDYTKRKEQYKAALIKWKAENNINWYARIPEKPKFRQDEDALEYAKRLCEYNKIVKVCKPHRDQKTLMCEIVCLKRKTGIPNSLRVVVSILEFPSAPIMISFCTDIYIN